MLSKKLAGKYQQTDKPVKDKNKNVLTTTWHRRKLPFEIRNFAKFCHKNWQILPKKKMPNLLHFATKIAKFCKLGFLIKVYFGPGGPEY